MPGALRPNIRRSVSLLCHLVRFSWLRLEWFYDIHDIDLILRVIVLSARDALYSLAFVLRSEHEALHAHRLDDGRRLHLLSVLGRRHAFGLVLFLIDATRALQVSVVDDVMSAQKRTLRLWIFDHWRLSILTPLPVKSHEFNVLGKVFLVV